VSQPRLQFALPVGLLALAALATFLPTVHAWAVLDREALANGEWWRLWTGHLAHFSASHLLLDAAVFVLLAAALCRAGERSLALGLFLGCAALSASLLASDGSLARYGGLSGVNALLLGWLAVRWLQAGGRQRALGAGLLVLAAGKFALDSLGLGAAGVQFDSAAVVPSHLSHWLGLGWGILLAAVQRPPATKAVPFSRTGSACACFLAGKAAPPISVQAFSTCMGKNWPM
jgi:rhomboid family GlyGly-CTERM serine protease